MLSEIYDHAERFDIIHSHVDFLAFPFSRLVNVPTVSTMHGRLDLDAFLPLYRSYTDLPMVSISNEQRRPLLFMNWIATVYHGLPKDLLRFNPGSGTYLAFLGRIAPEKRPDLAIEIARRSGMPLKIAAKVDRVDRDYFEAVIKPLLSTPRVEFLGEINDSEKQDFLGGALALLFTVDWPEPFGLAMIEAMACGTPVIARPCGSVPEVLRPGVTGLIASGTDDLVGAVAEVGKLARQGCREVFEMRFTSAVMAASYERVYYRLIDERNATAVTGRMEGRRTQRCETSEY
jgi:glycosyltransferase involved in cell wall biosynthesis